MKDFPYKHRKKCIKKWLFPNTILFIHSVCIIQKKRINRGYTPAGGQKYRGYTPLMIHNKTTS